MGTVTDLVAALHELTNGKKGKPADAIKNFNQLLNSRDQEFSNNVSKILDSFQPATSLGKLLRLKLIGRYKVASELCTLLQSDDTLQIKQVMKFDWFFKDVEHPRNFVQNVIPKLSLSTRLKIINRYARYLENTAAGESIYEGLKSNYGIQSAIPLLPSCGAEFVQKELANLTVLLPSSVLTLLLAKYQPTAIEYIKSLVSDESSGKQHNLDPYKGVFEQLSRKDPDTFFELFLKYRSRFPPMKFTRQPLQKAIGNHFDEISKCFCDIQHGVVDEEKFIRRLSLDQIKKLYVSSILPPTTTEFFNKDEWSDVFLFLTYVNPSLRSDFLISTFQAKYNKNCLKSDLLGKFQFFWLQYLPKEAKIDWVNLKVPEMDCVQDEAEAVAYLPVEISMPRLKQLITAQSDAKVRAAVAKHMVQTLNLNQCFSGIKDLVDYFVKRFRNETKGFRQTVISEMGLLGDLFLKMDWDDWSTIHDFIDIINLNDEVPICHGGLRSIYSQQIHACFLKELDLDPYLRGYVEFEQRAEERVKSSIVQIGKGTPYHKQCLEWYLKEYPTLGIESALNKEFSSVILDLMESLVEYNEKHKQAKIEMPDWLVMELDKLVSSDSINEWEVLKIFEMLTKNHNFELRDRLQLKHFPNHTYSNDLCRFLKKRPEVVLTNLDSLMNDILKTHNYDRWKYHSFIKRCKLYDDIRAEMVKVSLATLNAALKSDENFSELMRMKTNAVNVLTELMEPSKYLEFCSSRAPIKKDEENSKEIKIINRAVQRAIFKSLKRVSTPLETLSVLRKLSTGRYSKIVCSSTTGVTVRIPENIILPIFNEWVDCPVSLRKRILILTYMIGPVDHSIMTFEKLFKVEKRRSLQMVLFLKIRDRFFVEPTDKSYDLFISIVQQLTEDDKEILLKLLDIDNIHDSYISQYVELIWQLIDSKWSNVLAQGKSKIVEKVDKKLIKMLSNGVCDMLLAHELSLKLPKWSLHRYVYIYLLNSCSDEVQNHRLQTFMAALEPYFRTLWNKWERSSSGRVFVLRHLLSDVICSLCYESLNTVNSSRAASVLSSMKKAMLEQVELRDTLEECIVLDTYSLYLNLKGTGEESAYASALAELYNNYIEQYDSEFGYALMRALKSIDISRMLSKTELAHELLKNHTHPTCHILATKFLSNSLLEVFDVSLYKSIIEVLSTSCHPYVRIAAADYFRSLSVTDVVL